LLRRQGNAYRVFGQYVKSANIGHRTPHAADPCPPAGARGHSRALAGTRGRERGRLGAGAWARAAPVG